MYSVSVGMHYVAEYMCLGYAYGTCFPCADMPRRMLRVSRTVMKNRNFLRRALFLFVLLVHIGLAALVVFLMGHVQQLLDSDTKINLTEVVTQNKDAIASRLMLNIKTLEVVSTQITEGMKAVGIVNDEEVRRFINNYARENNTPNLFVADETGKVFWRNGSGFSISGRKYFRLSMEGTANISDKAISRIDGSEVFVISVPLQYQGKIIGTVQRLYTHEEMYQMCTPSLFSAQGFINVINSEGYIIIHSRHPNCIQTSDNYYRDLFSMGNEAASIALKEGIQHKRNGFMETMQNGTKVFSAYTSIGNAHDWFLITSVPTSIVSPNATLVIKIFYVILLVLILTFASGTTYFFRYKLKQRDQLEKIAFVDSVTGGNTYAKFVMDAGKALAASSGVNWHVVKFDVDNFKYINKFYGFEAGDHILRHIVEAVTPQLQPGEVLARISGDHFVMLLRDIANDRLDALFTSIEGGEISLYFSAGVYAVADRSESVNLMVDKASTAAQTVKGVLSQHVVYYTEEFDRINIHNEQLKRAVAQGLENNEFIPYFQPKVDINTRHLVGCEALARWRTAEGKLMSPAQFIPMSEQTGAIVAIDLMIYEKVLQFLSEHLKAGHQCVPVSVNFSRLHLLDEVFFDKVVDKLKEYNVPAHLIELELTESAIFDNLDRIYQFTERMHSYGLLIAMDDFGSGYSSLNMLKDVPIDILKIDKGFLDGAQDNTRRDIIFSSIVVMARKLHIRIVVEGVEYAENVELMRACGCSIAQGYYFAKPMSGKDFGEIIVRGHI